MTAPAKLALLSWALLALAVFSVTFDWQTRQAGWQFITDQLERRAQGQPLSTIEEGFRPLVRAAALQSSLWLLTILAAGTAATALASRRGSKDTV